MKNKNDLQLQSRLNSLFSTLSCVKSGDEMRAVLLDLCTPNELEAMADRWLIVPYLKQGIAYRVIQKKTGVSLTTITRVARILQFGEGGYELLIQRVK